MKKNSIFILLILCFFNSSCIAATNNNKNFNPPNKQFVKVYNELTILKCDEKVKKPCVTGTFIKTGSGLNIFIKKGVTTVITAGHVCSNSGLPKHIKNFTSVVKVMDYKGHVHQAHIIESTTDHASEGDLCSLYVPTMDPSNISMLEKDPEPGMTVYALAAPLGVYHPPTVPIFRGIYSGLVDASTAMTTVPGAGGASGAAILTEDGKVIGILYAVKQNFQNISLISSYKTTKAFIRKTRKKISKLNF